jgi:signal transduction histidine kinase
MLVHDLRSPLSVVQVTLQMLESDSLVAQSEYKTLIRESLASCNDFVRTYQRPDGDFLGQSPRRWCFRSAG